MKKKPLKHWTTIVLICFTLNAFSVPAQGLALPSVSIPAAGEVNTDSPFELEIPPSLGKIETIVSGTGPAIIHIQEAHGSYEGQKQIFQILKHLRRNYGIKQVLLEGTAFKLHNDLLQLYPQDQERTLKDLDRLAKKSLVTGPEFLMAQDKEIEAYGIEELETYKENSRVFVSVLRQKEKTEAFAGAMNAQMKNLASPYLGAELRAFLDRVESYELRQIPLDTWVEFLSSESRKQLSLDFTNPWNQKEWPMLLRVFTLKKLEANFDKAAFDKERPEFLNAVRRFVPQDGNDLNGKISESLSRPLSFNQLPHPETSRLFENMVSALPKDFNYALFPNVNRFIGHLILQSELDGTDFVKELERLEQAVTDKLAKAEQEKKLVCLLRQQRLLKRLFSLELTPEDYEAVLEQKESLSPQALSGEFLALNPEKRVKDKGFSHLDEMTKLFDEALEFYRLAKVRDEKMLAGVEKRLRETGENKAVVITGGFHSGPFTEHFKKRDFSYALITPQMRTSDGHGAYVNLFLDNFLSNDKPRSALKALPYAATSYDEMRRMDVDPLKVEHAITRELGTEEWKKNRRSERGTVGSRAENRKTISESREKIVHVSIHSSEYPDAEEGVKVLISGLQEKEKLHPESIIVTDLRRSAIAPEVNRGLQRLDSQDRIRLLMEGAYLNDCCLTATETILAYAKLHPEKQIEIHYPVDLISYLHDYKGQSEIEEKVADLKLKLGFGAGDIPYQIYVDGHVTGNEVLQRTAIPEDQVTLRFYLWTGFNEMLSSPVLSENRDEEQRESNGGDQRFEARTAEALNAVQSALQEISIPELEIFIFGSYADDKTRDGSDLDLILMIKEGTPQRRHVELIQQTTQLEKRLGEMLHKRGFREMEWHDINPMSLENYFSLWKRKEFFKRNQHVWHVSASAIQGYKLTGDKVIPLTLENYDAARLASRIDRDAVALGEDIAKIQNDLRTALEVAERRAQTSTAFAGSDEFQLFEGTAIDPAASDPIVTMQQMGEFLTRQKAIQFYFDLFQQSVGNDPRAQEFRASLSMIESQIDRLQTYMGRHESRSAFDFQLWMEKAFSEPEITPEILQKYSQELRPHFSNEGAALERRIASSVTGFKGTDHETDFIQLLETAALYILDRELEHPVETEKAEKDLSVLQSAVERYNQTYPGSPGLSVSMVMIFPLSVFFSESEEDAFVKLRSRLHLLPGNYGIDAAAFDLMVTGMHLRGDMRLQDLTDLSRVIPNLKFAIETLETGVDDDIRRKNLQFSVLKLILTIQPFLIPFEMWKLDGFWRTFDYFAPTSSSPEEEKMNFWKSPEMEQIRGLVSRHEPLIRSILNDFISKPKEFQEELIALQFYMFLTFYQEFRKQGVLVNFESAWFQFVQEVPGASSKLMTLLAQDRIEAGGLRQDLVSYTFLSELHSPAYRSELAPIERQLDFLAKHTDALFSSRAEMRDSQSREVPQKMDSEVELQVVQWDRTMEGFHLKTNENITNLIKALEGFPKGGAYLGLGSFHNLDLALSQEAEAVVLVDYDEVLMKFMRELLNLVARTDFKDIQEALRSSKIGKIVLDPLVKTPRLWLQQEANYLQLQSWIRDKKILLVGGDITSSETVSRIQSWLTAQKVALKRVNVSNAPTFLSTQKHRLRSEIAAVIGQIVSPDVLIIEAVDPIPANQLPPEGIVVPADFQSSRFHHRIGSAKEFQDGALGSRAEKREELSLKGTVPYEGLLSRQAEWIPAQRNEARETIPVTLNGKRYAFEAQPQGEIAVGVTDPRAADLGFPAGRQVDRYASFYGFMNRVLGDEPPPFLPNLRKDQKKALLAAIDVSQRHLGMRPFDQLWNSLPQAERNAVDLIAGAFLNEEEMRRIETPDALLGPADASKKRIAATANYYMKLFTIRFLKDPQFRQMGKDYLRAERAQWKNPEIARRFVPMQLNGILAPLSNGADGVAIPEDEIRSLLKLLDTAKVLNRRLAFRDYNGRWGKDLRNLLPEIPGKKRYALKYLPAVQLPAVEFPKLFEPEETQKFEKIGMIQEGGTSIPGVAETPFMILSDSIPQRVIDDFKRAVAQLPDYQDMKVYVFPSAYAAFEANGELLFLANDHIDTVMDFFPGSFTQDGLPALWINPEYHQELEMRDHPEWKRFLEEQKVKIVDIAPEEVRYAPANTVHAADMIFTNYAPHSLEKLRLKPDARVFSISEPEKAFQVLHCAGGSMGCLALVEPITADNVAQYPLRSGLPVMNSAEGYEKTLIAQNGQNWSLKVGDVLANSGQTQKMKVVAIAEDGLSFDVKIVSPEGVLDNFTHNIVRPFFVPFFAAFPEHIRFEMRDDEVSAPSALQLSRTDVRLKVISWNPEMSGIHLYTNENITNLIKALKDSPKGGAYLGLGSFHNLDIALDQNADTVVLVDFDQNVLRFLQKLLNVIQSTDFKDIRRVLREEGLEQDIFHNLAKTPRFWLEKEAYYLQLQEWIRGKKILLLGGDIASFDTAREIKTWLSEQHSVLRRINLSNMPTFSSRQLGVRAQLKAVLKTFVPQDAVVVEAVDSKRRNIPGLVITEDKQSRRFNHAIQPFKDFLIRSETRVRIEGEENIRFISPREENASNAIAVDSVSRILTELVELRFSATVLSFLKNSQEPIPSFMQEADIQEINRRNARAEARNLFSSIVRVFMEELPEVIQDEDLKFEFYSELKGKEKTAAYRFIKKHWGRPIEEIPEFPRTLDLMTAFYKGKLAGTYFFQLTGSQANGKGIHVIESFRRKGIGRRLREKLFMTLRDRMGVDKFYFAADPNPEAQGFHRDIIAHSGVKAYEETRWEIPGQPLMISHAIVDLTQFEFQTEKAIPQSRYENRVMQKRIRALVPEKIRPALIESFFRATKKHLRSAGEEAHFLLALLEEYESSGKLALGEGLATNPIFKRTKLQLLRNTIINPEAFAFLFTEEGRRWILQFRGFPYMFRLALFSLARDPQAVKKLLEPDGYKLHTPEEMKEELTLKMKRVNMLFERVPKNSVEMNKIRTELLREERIEVVNRFLAIEFIKRFIYYEKAGQLPPADALLKSGIPEEVFTENRVMAQSLQDLSLLILQEIYKINEEALIALYGTPDSKAAIVLGGSHSRTEWPTFDFDSVFVYEKEGDTSGGIEGALTNQEFYNHLARLMGTSLSGMGRRWDGDYQTTMFAAYAEKNGIDPDFPWSISLKNVNVALAMDSDNRQYRAVRFDLLIPGAGDEETARQFIEIADAELKDERSLKLAMVDLYRSVMEPSQRLGQHRSDIKEDPGGLRTIHYLLWFARLMKRLKHEPVATSGDTVSLLQDAFPPDVADRLQVYFLYIINMRFELDLFYAKNKKELPLAAETLNYFIHDHKNPLGSATNFEEIPREDKEQFFLELQHVFDTVVDFSKWVMREQFQQPSTPVSERMFRDILSDMKRREQAPPPVSQARNWERDISAVSAYLQVQRGIGAALADRVAENLANDKPREFDQLLRQAEGRNEARTSEDDSVSSFRSHVRISGRKLSRSTALSGTFGMSAGLLPLEGYLPNPQGGASPAARHESRPGVELTVDVIKEKLAELHITDLYVGQDAAGFAVSPNDENFNIGHIQGELGRLKAALSNYDNRNGGSYHFVDINDTRTSDPNVQLLIHKHRSEMREEILPTYFTEALGHKPGRAGEARTDLAEILKQKIGVPVQRGEVPVRFADFGTGNGDFVGLFGNYLRDLGYQIQGYGIDEKRKDSPDAQALGESYIWADIAELEEEAPQLLPGTFDVITMNAPQLIDKAVFLQNLLFIPGKFEKWLDAAKRLLSERGVMLIRLYEVIVDDDDEVSAEWMLTESIMLKRMLDADPELEYQEFTQTSTPLFSRGKTPLGPLLLVTRKQHSVTSSQGQAANLRETVADRSESRTVDPASIDFFTAKVIANYFTGFLVLSRFKAVYGDLIFEKLVREIAGENGFEETTVSLDQLPPEISQFLDSPKGNLLRDLFASGRPQPEPERIIHLRDTEAIFRQGVSVLGVEILFAVLNPHTEYIILGADRVSSETLLAQARDYARTKFNMKLGDNFKIIAAEDGNLLGAAKMQIRKDIKTTIIADENENRRIADSLQDLPVFAGAHVMRLVDDAHLTGAQELLLGADLLKATNEQIYRMVQKASQHLDGRFSGLLVQIQAFIKFLQAA